MTGTKTARVLRGRHRRVGPRRRADRAAGLQDPAAERVLVRSDDAAATARRGRRRRRAARRAARGRRRRGPADTPSSPPTAGAPRSWSPACAATPTTPRDHVAPLERAVADAARRAPRRLAAPGRRRHRRERVQRRCSRRTSAKAGMLSLPVTVDRAAARLRRARGRVRAAAARPHVGRRRDGRVRRRLAVRARRRLDRRARAADRPRRRRRLLAVLHPPRARGAPRGPRPGGRAGHRRRHRRPRDRRLRPHRDAVARRAADHRPERVHLDGARHDHRRRVRRARLADRAARDARAARRPDRPRPPAVPRAAAARAAARRCGPAIAAAVTAPPRRVAGHAVCLLGALAVPALRAEDGRDRAAGATCRSCRPSDAIERAFPGAPERRPARRPRRALDARRRAGCRRSASARWRSPAAAARSRVDRGRATAAPRSSPCRCPTARTDAAQRTVAALRDDVAPTAASVAPGAEALVTGDAAEDADFDGPAGGPHAARAAVRARAGVRAAGRRVPLGAAGRRDDRPEPAVARRDLRHPHRGVPARVGRGPARTSSPTAWSPLAAAVRVRDPVRALDGLHDPRARADPRGAARRALAPARRRPRAWRRPAGR